MTLSWQAPAGLATRGTVVVLPGRGEHAGVYERFGRRLAADAYAVYALDPALQDTEAPGDAWESVPEQVAAIAADAVTPLVLVGSDTGALRALQLASVGVTVDGLILAATPDPYEAAPEGDLDWELAARTTCPAHRSRLAQDATFVRGRLSQPIAPALAQTLDDAVLTSIDVPVLLLHGGADPIAPVSHALRVAESIPRAEIAVVGSAPHDVLNDATHRTVAAHVVQWLERLRDGPELSPLIKVLAPEPALRT